MTNVALGEIGHGVRCAAKARARLPPPWRQVSGLRGKGSGFAATPSSCPRERGPLGAPRPERGPGPLRLGAGAVAVGAPSGKRKGSVARSCFFPTLPSSGGRVPATFFAFAILAMSGSIFLPISTFFPCGDKGASRGLRCG